MGKRAGRGKGEGAARAEGMKRKGGGIAFMNPALAPMTRSAKRRAEKTGVRGESGRQIYGTRELRFAPELEDLLGR